VAAEASTPKLSSMAEQESEARPRRGGDGQGRARRVLAGAASLTRDRRLVVGASRRRRGDVGSRFRSLVDPCRRLVCPGARSFCRVAYPGLSGAGAWYCDGDHPQVVSARRASRHLSPLAPKPVPWAMAFPGRISALYIYTLLRGHCDAIRGDT
jgi:hypothetical protein